MRSIVSLFDTIAAAPVNHAQVAFQDAAGRCGYVCSAGALRVYYYVAGNGRVTFTDVRQGPPAHPPAV